ncbi:MAG: hypothetical protein ACP5RH_00210 [Leptodesmis sp.]
MAWASKESLDIPTPHTPLPSRWSLTTFEAIASGILHTMLASIPDFLRDW